MLEAAFTEITVIMEKVDHPLMLNCFNPIFKEYTLLKQTAGIIERTLFIKGAMPKIRQQAKTCTYYPFVRKPTPKTRAYAEMVHRNSGSIFHIEMIANQYKS